MASRTPGPRPKSRATGRRTRRSLSADGPNKAANATQDLLAGGGKITLRGKGGAAFKKHKGRAEGGAADGGKRGGNRGAVNNIEVAVTYGDTETALPGLLKGRIKGSSEATADQVVTLKHGTPKAANKDSRKIPKGAKQKLLVKRNHKVTDKRGRRYVGGDPNDRSLLGESTRRKKKRKVKESSNPFVRFFQQQIKKFKRKMYLRRANKAPVVLGDRARAVAEALELTQKQLKKLRMKFAEIDFSSMGNVSYEEFFEWLDERRSKFTDALYDQMIAKATGQMLSLDDFVIVVVLYSMYGRGDILKLIFNMFDNDGSGTIDEEEFMNLCTLVNDGAPTYPGNFQNALEQFDVNDDGLIDYEEFKMLNARYPIVLFPAFRLQDAIQVHTLGSKEWLRINERLTEKRRIEAYVAKHGTMPPPTFKQKLKTSDKIGFRLFRTCCRCFVPR